MFSVHNHPKRQNLWGLTETRCRSPISLLAKHNADKLVQTTPNSSGVLLQSNTINQCAYAVTRVSPVHISDFTGTDKANPRPAGINPHSQGG